MGTTLDFGLAEPSRAPGGSHDCRLTGHGTERRQSRVQHNHRDRLHSHRTYTHIHAHARTCTWRTWARRSCATSPRPLPSSAPPPATARRPASRAAPAVRSTAFEAAAAATAVEELAEAPIEVAKTVTGGEKGVRGMQGHADPHRSLQRALGAPAGAAAAAAEAGATAAAAAAAAVTAAAAAAAQVGAARASARSSASRAAGAAAAGDWQTNDCIDGDAEGEEVGSNNREGTSGAMRAATRV